MPARFCCLVPVLALFGALGAGCKSSPKETPRKDEAAVRSDPEEGRAPSCQKASDCADRDPCTRNECVDERCVASLSPRGTSCDDDNVCDGVALCDANGRCVPGEPPPIDDGNPCTIDSCDARRGPLHELVPVDDFDACTNDTCDPHTGEIAHVSLPIDDGNDCTRDSCDPRAGVRHEQPNGTYTCEPGCPAGFHVASRTVDPQCGSPQALRSFCAPDCGESFYTCATACPTGYRRKTFAPGGSCGTNPSVLLFCVKGQ